MITNAKFNTIAELDLGPIKLKLMHKESGEGWSLAQANAVELEYRRFLCLMKQFPHEQIAPMFDVDIFWHYHILDTMKYAADCEHMFGYFLHHFPYLGLQGEDEEAVAKQAGTRMQELYEASFGEAYTRLNEVKKVSAVTTYCSNFAQNDPVYYVRPAYCSNAAQNDSIKSVRPVLAAQTARMAYCSNAAQNDSVKWVRPAVPFAQTARTAYCSNAQRDSMGFTASGVRPLTARTAYCSNALSSDHSTSVPPALAQAA